jgi:hypothetical protein
MSLLTRIIERITGKRQVDFTELASDMVSEEGQLCLERKRVVEDQTIQQAWESPAVQQLAVEIGLTKEHVRDVYGRLASHGHLRAARRAIRDVAFLRWYYEHGGKDGHLDPDAAIQLFAFAESGRLE